MHVYGDDCYDIQILMHTRDSVYPVIESHIHITIIKAKRNHTNNMHTNNSYNSNLYNNSLSTYNIFYGNILPYIMNDTTISLEIVGRSEGAGYVEYYYLDCVT